MIKLPHIIDSAESGAVCVPVGQADDDHHSNRAACRNVVSSRLVSPEAAGYIGMLIKLVRVFSLSAIGRGDGDGGSGFKRLIARAHPHGKIIGRDILRGQVGKRCGAVDRVGIRGRKGTEQPQFKVSVGNAGSVVAGWGGAGNGKRGWRGWRGGRLEGADKSYLCLRIKAESEYERNNSLDVFQSSFLFSLWWNFTAVKIYQTEGKSVCTV